MKLTIEMILPNVDDPRKADQVRFDPLIFQIDDGKNPKALPPGVVADVRNLVLMGYEYARKRELNYPTALLYQQPDVAKEPQPEQPAMTEEVCGKCSFVKSQCFCEV